jgi:hypothetical protein
VRRAQREAPAAANRDRTVRLPTTATNPAAPAARQPYGASTDGTGRDPAARDHTARGIVEFEQPPPGSSGPMTIHVMLMGLDAGPHGMHVHGHRLHGAGYALESAGRAARTGERGFWHAPSR